jgi:hypothetical protein
VVRRSVDDPCLIRVYLRIVIYMTRRPAVSELDSLTQGSLSSSTIAISEAVVPVTTVALIWMCYAPSNIEILTNVKLPILFTIGYG